MSAIVSDPQFPWLAPFSAMLGRAVESVRAGEHGAARIWLEAASYLHGVDEKAFDALTAALVGSGRAADAAALAELGRQLRPDSPAALFNCGYALQMAGRHADAIAPYRQVLAIAPAWPSLKNNLAIAVRLADGDPADEIALLEGAVADDPRDSEAWINLVTSRLRRFDLDGALSAADTALALAPDSVLALNNAVAAYKEAQRWDDARRCAERACALAPGDASYRFNLSILDLVRGDFDAGWPGFDARWDGSGELRGRMPAFSGPRWRGEPLAGKTLVVWGEQGMGDLLQFCRYVPRLAEHVHREGGRLVWNAFPQMGALLSRSLGAHVDGYGAGGIDDLPAFDYEVPLMSVPAQLGLGRDALGDAVPYLRPDARALDAWRARLRADAPSGTRLAVGLAWTGSMGHQRNPFRRVGLERYACAFRGIEGVAFYSLQPGADDEVAQARAAGFDVIDHTRELRTFDDTAAFVGALDLVVTVCTSVAHLSGALGQRTWVLLDVNPHWPWLLERRDSPSYPTATLYRQQRFAQWEPVIDEVARDLRDLAAGNV